MGKQEEKKIKIEGEKKEEVHEKNENLEEQKKLQELENKVKEYEDLVRRQAADFDNFRKRTKQEKEALGEMVAEKIILEFLPVYDNFERALKAAEDQKNFKSFLEGVKGIYNIFTEILEKNKIQKIDSVGQPFDHRYHEALYMVEGDYEKPIVLEEVEKAFLKNEKVIRIARVSVGMPKKGKTETQNS